MGETVEPLELFLSNPNFRRMPIPYSKYGVIANYSDYTVRVVNLKTGVSVVPTTRKNSDRLFVNLYTDDRDPHGKLIRKTIQLGEAVLQAFKGPPRLAKQQVSHLDDDCMNNMPENLKWEAQGTNLDRHLLVNNGYKGANNPRAKLTEQQRQQIVEQRLKEGWTDSALARKWEVYPSTIGNILKAAGITTRGWRRW